MVRNSLVLSGGLVVIALAIARISAESCTLCVNGAPPDLNGVLTDGTSCSELNNAALETPSSFSEDCLMLQGLGYQTCACETPPPLPEDACRICPDGFTVSNPGLEIFGINSTCGSLEIVANLFLDSTEYCGILPQFAYYCGCPHVEPACTACPSGLKISKPQLIVSEFGFSCGEAELIASLAPNQTACEEFQEAFMVATEDDFCGCFETSPLVTPTTSPSETPSAEPTLTPTTGINVFPTSIPDTIQPTPLPTMATTADPTSVPEELTPTSIPDGQQPTPAPTLSTPKPTTVPTEPSNNPPTASPTSHFRTTQSPTRTVFPTRTEAPTTPSVIPDISNDIGSDPPSRNPSSTPTPTTFSQPSEPVSSSKECPSSTATLLSGLLVSLAVMPYFL